MKELFFALENGSFGCTLNRSRAARSQVQAFLAKLPSIQKLLGVRPLAVVQFLEWEQHGALSSSVTRKQRAIGWVGMGWDERRWD